MGSSKSPDAGPGGRTRSGADPQCVIPGCTDPVGHSGDTCPDCLDDFGPYLRHSDAPALARQQIADRDDAVKLALALQHQVREINQTPAALRSRPA
ncbi:hypothetical protein H7I87_03245 [Mycobacterium timonense]|uniref:Uncharacterized protein n=2 Tax=Mycobacterium TaxID=1763 RepID=A0AAW5SBL0_MYCBC|nr:MULTISPECIES: hypothetical protein [Mycobacterium]ETB46787.1 hypothetical protein O981_27005 [Mycobacterium avium 10-5560]MCV6992127.1 hypothetical protein [Mycobacterium bouchedurhonense]MCV6993747.1 hypothetical protein [Mycobacterium timonense]ORA45337.1 hypothetical protein BST19_20405 [Mycobacterium bouchedurhonense]CQD02000.1 hypothetical protein BN000_00053 [Mycobacterium europaeum]